MFGEEADEAFVCWDYGPELSRRFRALKVWMLLKGVGLDWLSEAIESNLSCARHLELMVQASDDFEMAGTVELSIFCPLTCHRTQKSNRLKQSTPSMNACWSLCSETAVRISRMPRSVVGSRCAVVC